jgi:cytochrome c5
VFQDAETYCFSRLWSSRRQPLGTLLASGGVNENSWRKIMKRIEQFVLILITVLVSVGIAVAAGGPNPNHGKSVFKTTCKMCHVKSGDAKELTPMSKTQEQWKRVFKQSLDKCVKKVEDKTGKKLTPAELDDMQAFLVAHAADSDHPETCGGN